MKRRTVRENEKDMLNTQNIPLLSFRGILGERGNLKEYDVNTESMTLKFPQEFAKREERSEGARIKVI